MGDEQRPEPEATPDAEVDATPRAEPDWVRRRRLAAVFGDVLPEATSDDAAEPGSEPAAEQNRSEEWLRRQVPPHHG